MAIKFACFAVAPVAASAVFGSSGGACDIAKGERKDCFADEGSCASKGCCWKPVNPNPDNLPWCFHSNGPLPPSPPTPPPSPPPSCDVFHENQCAGNVIVTDPSFEDHRWLTPLKGDKDYHASFQDYGKLVGHAHVVYSDTTLTSATVEIIAKHKDPSVALTYIFDGKEQSSPKATFASPQAGTVSVAIKGADGSVITLDPLDFHWTAKELKARSGDFRGGQKGSLVEMFGWPHADIEAECKDLADMGYMGVKVFPVHEQLMAAEPYQNMMNPWYFMYQPVSYRLQGRMGTRDDLRKLISTCRSYGVRVFTDAVVNHMAGSGNDANTHHRNPGAGCAKWGNKSSSLPGGPSPSYTQGFSYVVGKNTGKPPSQEFPGVPYGPMDFHCERSLNSWTDPLILNAGWLSGLVDINTERENVRERIADYFTDLISIGFTGFRIDAAKHIKPDDLVAILSKFRRNVGGKLPSDFFTWLEVILGGEADMLMCKKDSGYNFGSYLTGKLKEAGFSDAEVLQVKTWNSGYPKEIEKGTDDCDPAKSGLQRQVIQNDDHDQQNPGSSSRDMGSQGCVLIKGCPVSDHRAFEVKLFTNPNGATDNNNDYPIRNVLSSFYWGTGGVQGIPDGLSDCKTCVGEHCDTCQNMPYQKAHDPSSTGYDSGDGKYTRAHRDPAIVNALKAWMGIGETEDVIV